MSRQPLGLRVYNPVFFASIVHFMRERGRGEGEGGERGGRCREGGRGGKGDRASASKLLT